MIMINKEQKLALMQDRYNKMDQSSKNIKCPGVKKKLARQIRNLSK